MRVSNDQALIERAQRMVDNEYIESKGAMTWWYLSYADDDGFLGGLYLRAFGPVSASVRAGIEGLSPGGEVRIVGPLPVGDEEERLPPPEDRERLLSLEELKKFAPMVRWNGEEI